MLYFKKKVFIYRLSQGSVAALTFPLDVASGDNSLVAECRLERTLWWPLLLQSTGSWAHRLQQPQFPGSSKQAQQLWHTGLAAPRLVRCSLTGVKPVSPALAGRLSPAEPPGEQAPLYCSNINWLQSIFFDFRQLRHIIINQISSS